LCSCDIPIESINLKDPLLFRSSDYDLLRVTLKGRSNVIHVEDSEDIIAVCVGEGNSLIDFEPESRVNFRCDAGNFHNITEDGSNGAVYNIANGKCKKVRKKFK
jgi:hypothetical protein